MPKYFRKVPTHVKRQLGKVDADDVVAGCVVHFDRKAIEDGALRHLGIALTSSGLEFPDEAIPPAKQGKYSERNVDGFEIKRKDLPMEDFTVAIETPNWGDASRGTHTVYQTRQRYPVEFHAPRESAIKIECLDSAPGRDKYAIKFEVSEVMNRKGRGFNERLLESLNLLQENVGACGVAKAGASFSDYVQAMRVKWELLPPGTKEQAVARVFGSRTPNPDERKRVEDRYAFLMGLKPKKLVYGSSGLQRYFGAQVTDDLVVFENMEHGNAIYVMFEEWQTLSQRSRLELLSGRYGKGFERVVHAGGWKARVKEIIAAKR